MESGSTNVKSGDGVDNLQSSPEMLSNRSGGVRDFLAGNFCILLATIFFGVNIPVVKELIPKWMTAMDVTVFRLMGGCVLMWIASIFVRTQKIVRNDMWRMVVAGVLGLFAFIFLFNLSLHYGDPIDISIIMTLPPVFVILIGVVFLHRRTTWLEIVGVIVSFAGAAAVIATQDGSTHEGSNRILGDLLAVASTLCYGFYLVMMEGPSHTYKPVNVLRWVFLYASIPAIALLPAFPHAAIFHTAGAVEPWLLIGFVVLCPTFLAYFLIQPATKLIGSELVSLYQYFLPVVATIATVAMGLSKLHWIQVVAMVIIILGMIVTNVAKRHQAMIAPH